MNKFYSLGTGRQDFSAPKKPLNLYIKTLTLFAVFIMYGLTSKAQVSGIKDIPGDYPTLAQAISDLNTQGVGPGGVTLNLLSGNPETAPAGGYVIGGAGSALLTTANSSNPVIITGNGNTITASDAHTAGVLTDAIFKLIGADWITIQGFIMQENAANTTTAAATNNMTEWAVALLYATTTDGAQNNTIQNNTISLNRTYGNTFGIYSNTRHNTTTVTTTADITAASGSNSFNKVYTNNINNVNYGIVFIGAAATANMDQGTDIGGVSSATGNNITNWGGSVLATTYIGVTSSNYCIYTNHQLNDNISFNSITSGSGNATTTVQHGGILKTYSTSPLTGTLTTSNINNNTVHLINSPTTGQMTGVTAQGMTSLAAATINMNNNIISGSVNGTPTSALFVGVFSTSAPGTLNMNGNTIRNVTSNSTSGGFMGIAHQTNAVVNALNINNNKIGDQSAGAVIFNNATSGGVTGITVSAAASTCALSIQNNDFRGIVHAVAGTSTHTYIINSAATHSQNISNNTFTNLNVNTTGIVTFISNSVSLTSTGSKNINNNSIINGFNKGGSGGSITFYTDGGASTPTGSISNANNNNFSNISVTGTTSIAGWSNADGLSSTSAAAKSFTGNTFSNITGSTGSITIASFSWGGNTNNISNNTFSNITSQGTITILNLSSNNNNLTVNQNHISSISSSGASSAITGIVISSGTTVNASNNTIHTLSGSGASSPVINGLSVTSGTTVNVFKNKIYGLSQSGTISTTSPAINGMLFSGSTTVNAYNNYIGNLNAPAASIADAIRGISVTSTTSSATYNISYNTVHLNATSAGTNFGTTGIFHTTSTTATTAALNLRNNIISNNSTSNGSGLTVAFRRNNATLTNYGSVSNNNLFYSNGLIFFDGTNSELTLMGYQTRVGPTRDAQSKYENPPFVSTTGGDPMFLHINISTPTQIESGGIAIGGINDDFDGDVRFGSSGYSGTGTAPDIGADEFNGTMACFSSVSISAATLSICQGESGTELTAICTNNCGNNQTFTWVPATGLTPVSNSEVIANPLSTTTYTVNMVTDAGCTGDASVTVTVNPRVTMTSVTASPATICSGGTSQLQAIATITPSSGLTYTWSPIDFLNDPTIANPIASGVTATTTYTVTATSASGCSVTGTVTVTAGQVLVCNSLTLSGSACPDLQTISAAPSGGGTPYSYSWTKDGVPVGGNTASITADVGSYLYEVTITDACGATCVSSLTVTTRPSPVITVNSETICNPGGAAVTLTATGANTYTWSPTAGLTPTTGSVVTANPASTTIYTVTGTDANGCTANATSTVTVAGAVTNVIATATPSVVCSGGLTNLNTTATNNQSGTPVTILSENFNTTPAGWTLINNTTGGTPSNTAWTLRQSPYTSPNSTPVTFSSNDASGFILSNADHGGSGTNVHTILQSPVFSTVGYNSASIQFFHHYRLYTSGEANIEASINGTNWTTIKSYTSNQGTPVAFILDNIPLPSAFINQSGVQIRFRYQNGWAWYWAIDNFSVLGISPTPLTYNWTSSPAGFTSSEQNPTGVVVPVTTTYTVTATNSAGCSASGSIIVTAGDPLSCGNLSLSGLACPSLQTITASASGGGLPYSYSWTKDGLPVGGNTASITADIGSYLYEVTITDACGATCTSSLSVTTHPPPAVSVNSGVICNPGGTAVTLTATGANTYAWSPTAGLTPTTGSVVTANPTSTTTYTVTGTDVNGCTSTATSTVTVASAVTSVTATANLTTVCTEGTINLSANAISTDIIFSEN